ncbi:MAG TPA: potassium/proton antiporter [Solirubrobacterales bacterium]
MSDAQLLLLAGALMAVGLAAAKVADRARIPGLLLFLGLGMLLGEEGIGGVEFDDAELTRTIGTIGLVLILFEGGLTAGWNEIRPVIGTAVSLATIGTLVTAGIAGAAAVWLFDLEPLEGLILGTAIATTDSAAIFAVLRGSTVSRRLARTLEGESGLNDPVALLLTIGFIDLLLEPGFGADDLILSIVIAFVIGVPIGLGIGWLAREAFRRLDLPSPGLYPVASLATAALAYGAAEVLHGSGFASVYVAGLVLGTGSIPARGSTVAFHQGVSWTMQITLFVVLGLLVFPSGLIEIAPQGLALSAVLMFVARPVAAYLASALAPLNARERLLLGWAGLRGAIPIWLATFPVIAGVGEASDIFNAVFFVVVTSTLIQGATFEPLARRLGLTTTEPALPRPIVETGIIRRLGGETFTYTVHPRDAIVGRMVKELGLPREALVNVIVREDAALLPRGSTEIAAGDELHIVSRREAIGEVERLTERWRSGPIGEPPPAALPPRGAPQVFTVRKRVPDDGDPARPEAVEGVAVATRLRERRDVPGSLVGLVDGRYALVGSDLVAVGGRRQMVDWAVRRGARPGLSPQERAWWQEVAGALSALPGPGTNQRA